MKNKQLGTRLLTEAARIDGFTSFELRKHLASRGLALPGSKVGGLLCAWQSDGLLAKTGEPPKARYSWREELPTTAEHGFHSHRSLDDRLIHSHAHGPWRPGHTHRMLLPAVPISETLLPDRAGGDGDGEHRDRDGEQGDVGQGQVAPQAPLAGGPQPVADQADQPGDGKTDDGHRPERPRQRQQQKRGGGKERADQRRPAHRDRLGRTERAVLEEDAGAHAHRAADGHAESDPQDRVVRAVVDAEDHAQRGHQPVEPAEQRLARDRPSVHPPKVRRAPRPDVYHGAAKPIGPLSTWVGRPCLECDQPIAAKVIARIRYADDVNVGVLGIVHADCA